MRRAVGSLMQKCNRRLPWLKSLVPVACRRFLLTWTSDGRAGLDHLPDRIWMETEILPRIARGAAGTVLFVGCAPYTWRYRRFFTGGATRYVTTDINPGAIVWGAREHVTCPVQEIHTRFPADSIDVVILNGVFGFGVDSESDMNRAVSSIHRVLTPAGALLIGWNTDLVPDPVSLDAVRRLYRHEGAMGLAARKSFENDTHVYDLFRPLDTRERAPALSTASGR